MSARIVHLTSVHAPEDNRIFWKECASAAARGFDVTLIVPTERNDLIAGVRIVAVPKPASRVRRITRTIWQVYRKARELRSDIYHFHDPELIPIGLLLRLSGASVVYDVHEDYVSSVLQKDYIPRSVRAPLARLIRWAERIATSAFAIVLAETYYQRTFQHGLLVRNYPALSRFDFADCGKRFSIAKIRLLYTGNVTEDRGALIHASLVRLDDRISITCVGRCSPDLAQRMKQAAGEGASRLSIIGVGEHVPFQTIVDHYREGGWSGGLAVFPDTPHYREKELTKFFEYMAAGIPIVCSSFPRWREIVEGGRVGICLNPDNVQEGLESLLALAADAARLERMASRGRRAVMEKFNWESEMAKLCLLYEQLAGAGSATDAASG